MLQKTVLDQRDVQVTFRKPPLDGVVELYLCGEFNNWHTAGAPPRVEPDGSCVVTLVLQAGKSYRFRYLDNQGRWHNDWDADAYVPNDFGTEDSVVDLIAPLEKTPRALDKTRGKEAFASKGTRPMKRPSEKGAATKGAPKGPTGRQKKEGKGKSGGTNASQSKGTPRALTLAASAVPA